MLQEALSSGHSQSFGPSVGSCMPQKNNLERCDAAVARSGLEEGLAPNTGQGRSASR